VSAGIIFDTMRFAVHDGPGIRTTVFFKGCPLRCQWCHNPESQRPGPELMLREDRCIGCGECVRVCPTGAARRLNPLTGGPGHDAPSEDPSAEPGASPTAPADTAGGKCRSCGECAKACPSAAREMVGRTVTAGEILAEIEKDLVFYDESGGGVTFSGGEPLMQPELLGELLALLRGRGIRTCVDTSGFASPEVLAAVAPHVDTFLYDLKLIDDEAHRRFTGVSNAPILANLRALVARHPGVVVRIPVVPGVNDDDRNVAEIGEFLRCLGGQKEGPADGPGRASASGSGRGSASGTGPIPPVSLLPYHQAGVGKYRRLGRGYPLPDTPPPSEARMEELAGRLREYGLDVRIGR